MGTDVCAVGMVGNRDGANLEPRVRGGVDPPTWQPGSGARQVRVGGGTPRSDGKVRVGFAKHVVQALNSGTLFCLCSCAHAVCVLFKASCYEAAPPRAFFHVQIVAFVEHCAVVLCFLCCSCCSGQCWSWLCASI